MFDWQGKDETIIQMLQSGAALKDVARELGCTYKALVSHCCVRGIHVKKDGTREYQIVRCFFYNCDKFNGDIVAAICDKYDSTPDEVNELVERETAAVVDAYARRRSYKWAAVDLLERYEVKPSDEFMRRALKWSGRLEELKAALDPPQPADAIFVPDPDGVYCGFWLTEEQAIRLAEIRCKIRCRGNGNVFHRSRIGDYFKIK